MACQIEWTRHNRVEGVGDLKADLGMDGGGGDGAGSGGN